MKQKLAAALIVCGLAIAFLAHAVLPQDKGRFADVIEIVDPRPASQSEMTPELQRLKALRMVLMEQPDPGPSGQVLLLPDIRLLKASDCALGRLPERDWEAAAGASTGIRRGQAALRGAESRIVGILQPLGATFDSSLVMALSEEVLEQLQQAGWRSQAHYLLPTRGGADAERLLGRLKSDPAMLPTPKAQILSPAHPSGLSRTAIALLAVLLICAGASLLGWGVRSIRRQGLAPQAPRGVSG